MKNRREVLAFFLLLAVFTLLLMYVQISKYGSLSGFIAYDIDEPSKGIEDEEILSDIGVYLLQPEDGFQSTNGQTEFICEYSGGLSLQKVIFYLRDNNGAEVYSYQEEAIAEGQTSFSFNYLILDSGSYSWNCDFVDTNDQVYSAENDFSLILDNSPPEVTLNSPQEGELFDTIFEQTFVDFSFDVLDMYSNECDLIVDDIIEESFSGESTGSYFTSQSIGNGQHLWKVSCTDELGNQGFSRERTFVVEVVEEQETEREAQIVDSGVGAGGGSGGQQEETQEVQEEVNLDTSSSEDNSDQEAEDDGSTPIENIRVFMGRVISPIFGDKLSPIALLLLSSVLFIVVAMIILRFHHKKQSLKEKVDLEHKLR